MVQCRRPQEPLVCGGAMAAGYGDTATGNSRFFDGPSCRLVWGSNMFHTFINDFGTDMIMLMWFAEDTKLSGIANKARDALQAELYDLDYSNRNEMKFNSTKWKVLPLGVNSNKARYPLGANFAVGYRLLMYSRWSQAFLFLQGSSFKLMKQVLWSWKS